MSPVTGLLVCGLSLHLLNSRLLHVILLSPMGNSVIYHLPLPSLTRHSLRSPVLPLSTAHAPYCLDSPPPLASLSSLPSLSPLPVFSWPWQIWARTGDWGKSRGMFPLYSLDFSLRGVESRRIRSSSPASAVQQVEEYLSYMKLYKKNRTIK